MSVRSVRSFAAALLALAVFQTAAWADVIEGRVARSDAQTLDVTVYDPQGRPYPNDLRLSVDPRARLDGVSSVSGLRPGDPISADVHQLESGNWQADHITLFQEAGARPATKNPPPTMRDVLGNPVVKGALLGAATGAIASGTSGGKTGKGALIGAGVGALGGLFFGGGNQNQNQNQDQDQDR